jgi:hypothetical protein
MGTIVGVAGVTRGENAKDRQVVVAISALAFEALTNGDEAAAPLKMESALRCYLGDRDAARPAWPYPSFLRGSETEEDVRVELEVPENLWADFEEEAIRQDVTIPQLAEHAAFYLAAELDAGRVTQRILDDPESSERG